MCVVKLIKKVTTRQQNNDRLWPGIKKIGQASISTGQGREIIISYVVQIHAYLLSDEYLKIKIKFRFFRYFQDPAGFWTASMTLWSTHLRPSWAGSSSTSILLRHLLIDNGGSQAGRWWEVGVVVGGRQLWKEFGGSWQQQQQQQVERKAVETATSKLLRWSRSYQGYKSSWTITMVVKVKMI